MKNIKLAFCLSLFFLLSVNGFGQTDKTVIEKTFRAYLQTIANKEFTKSIDYIPNELFEIVKKEQLIQVMEMTMNNPAIETKIGDLADLEIQEVKEINGKFYALLKYKSTIHMKFKPENEKETDEERKSRNNMTKLAFQNSFGVNNVKLNEETSWFTVDANKSAYAISKDGKSDWKFMVIEPKQRLILDKILPKELTDKI